MLHPPKTLSLRPKKHYDCLVKGFLSLFFFPMRWALVWLLQTLTVAAFAQADVSPLQRMASRLERFGRTIPQEKVYVHMDNTSYFLGDTLWFAAYTRRTDSGTPSRVSRVLYTELWNHDGFLVERKLIEMKDGRGHGFFALHDSLYAGYYELRAYTRWQLNWGQTEHQHTRQTEYWFYNKRMAEEYFCDYEKLYSRVFPVYDKPEQEGLFFRDMTLRPLRRSFKDAQPKPRLCLSLFPEGGNLVAGVPCRVAFEAATSDGQACEGEVKLMRGKDVITTARTENRGRGTFLFTPQEGVGYRVLLNDSVTQELKPIRAEGAALRVSRDSLSADWLFDIAATGQAARQPMGITVMQEGRLTFFQEITADKPVQLRYSTTQPGVHQVTLFDSLGYVYADRLFFVTLPQLGQPTLEVSGWKEKYQPYEPVELNIQAAASLQKDSLQAVISLAVRDAQLSDDTYDSGDILCEMLLASEVKGFVPRPDYFFEKDDPEHRRALDLLMLTQGWRRFNWRDMAVAGTWNITHPAEHTQKVSGIVACYQADISSFDRNNDIVSSEHEKFMNEGEAYNVVQETSRYYGDSPYGYQDKNGLEREVMVHAEFVNLNDPSDFIVGDVETKDGKFQIDLPRLNGACFFFLAASDTTQWKKGEPHSWVEVDPTDEYSRNPTFPEYYVRLSFPYPRWVKPYHFYQTRLAAPAKLALLEHRPDTSQTRNDLSMDDTSLKEVTVRARRGGLRRIDYSKPAYVIDAYEALNLAMDAGLIDYTFSAKEIARCMALTLLGDMGSERPYKVKTSFNSRPGMNTGPLDERRQNLLAYIDEIYLYTDYSPRREGDARFEGSNQPDVTVDLRPYADGGQRLTYVNRRYILPGFAFQEDFYHPDYRRKTPTPETHDYRRTLYWNPELSLDADGRARVHFFTGSREASLRVEGAGQTIQGQLLFTKP